MKLTKKAIEKIRKRNVILKLALALGFTEYWMGKLIDANKSNGPLTTATALGVIKQETKMDESQILEVEPVKG
jgi:hypothetical protein